MSPATQHQPTLDALMEAGTAFARRLHKEADTVDVEHLPALARAFERIATAVRRTIILVEHLAKPAPDPSARRTQIRKTIIRRVERIIHKEVEPPDAESLRIELIDRLDTPESDQDIDFRPSADIVQEILDDMGLARLPFQSERPRRTPEDIELLNARAARRPPKNHPAQTPHRQTHPQTSHLPKTGTPGLPRPPETQTQTSKITAPPTNHPEPTQSAPPRPTHTHV